MPLSAVLRDSSTYALILADLIVAKVRSYNERGWSAYSPVNTAGITVQTEPIFMNAPSRGAATSPSLLEVNWDTLTSP